MNWEPQHLPRKWPELQIDRPVFSGIPVPRVLDASLALPKSVFIRPLPPWQNVRRPDGILELRMPGQRRGPCDTLENDGYPHNDNGLPMRGKRFIAGEWNPKNEMLGGLPEEGFTDQFTRIKEWEEAYRPKLETLMLDDLTAVDYNKVYAENANIKLNQIKFASMTEDRWLTYRRIEGALNKILMEAHLAGKPATEYRPLSPYPPYHDMFLQLRIRVSKATGIRYQTVSLGLNHILKKELTSKMRTDAVYLDACATLSDEWNRTCIWQMDCEKVIEAREKHGKDWITKDPFVWSCDPIDDGQYTDRSWQHWRRYTNEHGTLL